jgi:hypothetical protein
MQFFVVVDEQDVGQGGSPKRDRRRWIVFSPMIGTEACRGDGEPVLSLSNGPESALVDANLCSVVTQKR